MFKRTDWYCIIFIVILTIFFASFTIAGLNFTHIAVYLNVADNLRQGNDFTVNFIPNSLSLSTESIINDYPTLNWFYSKPPLYPIFLAGFFEVFSSDTSNWLFYSNVFNLTISIAFIISYFAFCKKYFNREIAILSSVIIATSTLFIMNLTGSNLHTLAYLFVVLAFLFLDKKRLYYILFGVFAALASLTHALAIVTIVSYSSYLLCKKEFRGVLIVVSVWLALLSPWMVTLFYRVGDFGNSLGIPFSGLISTRLFGSTLTEPQLGAVTIDPSQQLPWNPIDFFNLWFFEKTFTIDYHQEFIVYLMIFAVFAFISFKKIREKKGIIKDKIPRIYVVILFFVLISIVSQYTLIMISDVNLPLPYVGFPMLFLLLPIGVLGVKKIIVKLSKAIIFEKRREVVSGVILGIMIIISANYTIPDTIDSLSNKLLVVDPNSKLTFDWIRTNIDKNSVLMYDTPPSIYKITGNPVVLTPYGDLIEIARYIEYYDVKYLVGSYNDVNNLGFVGILSDVIEPVYSNSDIVFEIDLSSNQFSSMLEGINLEKEGKPFDALQQYYSSEVTIPMLVLFQKESIASVYTMLDVLGWEPQDIKSINYDFPVPNVVFEVKKFEKSTPETIQARTELINAFLLELERIVLERAEKIFDEVEKLEYSGNFREALENYDFILKIDPDNLDMHKGKIRVTKELEKNNIKTKNDVLKAYIDLYEVLRTELDKPSGYYDLENLEKEFFSAISAEARYWETEKNYHRLLNTYERSLGYDAFNYEAWYGKATTLEKLGKTEQAKNAYAYALRFAPEEFPIIPDSPRVVPEDCIDRMTTLENKWKESGVDVEDIPELEYLIENCGINMSGSSKS